MSSTFFLLLRGLRRWYEQLSLLDDMLPVVSVPQCVLRAKALRSPPQLWTVLFVLLGVSPVFCSRGEEKVCVVM